jgi:hypothetical protein
LPFAGVDGAASALGGLSPLSAAAAAVPRCAVGRAVRGLKEARGIIDAAGLAPVLGDEIETGACSRDVRDPGGGSLEIGSAGRGVVGDWAATEDAGVLDVVGMRVVNAALGEGLVGRASLGTKLGREDFSADALFGVASSKFFLASRIAAGEGNDDDDDDDDDDDASVSCFGVSAWDKSRSDSGAGLWADPGSCCCGCCWVAFVRGVGGQ